MLPLDQSPSERTWHFCTLQRKHSSPRYLRLSSPIDVYTAPGWQLSEGLHRIRIPTVEASLLLKLETSPSSRWGKSQKRHHGPETSCPTSDKTWTPEAPTFCEVLSVLNIPGSSATSVWPRKPLHVCWPETCHQEAPSDWAWETKLIN